MTTLRCAVGFRKSGEVVTIVAERSPMSILTFADWLEGFQRVDFVEFDSLKAAVRWIHDEVESRYVAPVDGWRWLASMLPRFES